MSETNGIIYCPECGKENLDTFKFCNNCGAKLHQQNSSFVQSTEEEPQLTYEKPEAEIVSEGKVPLTQQEININYGSEEEGSYSSNTFTTPKPEYYSNQTSTGKSGANGNIGFSIASMVCGILSLTCCCLTFFSLILAIVAIVFGVISLNSKYDGRGMAIAGIITGGIGIVVWLFVIILNGSTAFITAMDELL